MLWDASTGSSASFSRDSPVLLFWDACWLITFQLGSKFLFKIQFQVALKDQIIQLCQEFYWPFHEKSWGENLAQDSGSKFLKEFYWPFPREVVGKESGTGLRFQNNPQRWSLQGPALGYLVSVRQAGPSHALCVGFFQRTTLWSFLNLVTLR